MTGLCATAFLWIAIFGVLQAPNNKATAKNNSGGAGKTGATTSTQHSSASSPDQTAIAPSQKIEPPVDKAKTGKSSDDIEIQRQLAKYTRNLVWVGIGQAVVLALTLIVIWRQATLMKAHAEHLKSLAVAAESSTIAAGGQLKAMQDQLGQMEESGRQTDKMLEAARKSADAAKISADIAAGVAIPKLVVHEIRAGNAGAAALQAMLQLPKIDLTVKNYGQTPALLRSWAILFTCEELPDIPVYIGQPGCGIVLTHEVIQPHDPYTLTVVNHWNRQTISLDDVQSIIERKKTLNAYGYVSYEDIFGNPPQLFKFFATALNMGDGWIDWRTELAPDAYVGTARLEIGSQPSRSDAKTNHPEKAN
jgi:hypothetical protein